MLGRYGQCPYGLRGLGQDRVSEDRRILLKGFIVTVTGIAALYLLSDKRKRNRKR